MNKFRQMEKYTEIVNILKEYHDTEQGSYYWNGLEFFGEEIAVELNMKTGEVTIPRMKENPHCEHKSITTREYRLLLSLNNL